MRKLIVLLPAALLLSISLLSQVFNVVHDNNGKLFGVKVYDGTSFQKYKFERIASEGNYEFIIGNKIYQLDHNNYLPQYPSYSNHNESTIDIFEPGLIPEGDLLRALEYSPDGSVFAALYQHSDNVFFYDASDLALLGIVDIGREPMDIKISSQSAYICCHTSNEVYIIDMTDFSITNRFDVFEYPCQIEINPNESIVYVACDSFMDGSVAAYNSNSGEEIFHTYDPFIHHYGSAGAQGRISYTFTKFRLTPDKSYLIAVNTNGQWPSVFDAYTGELVKTFESGGKMRGSGYSENGDTIYLYTVQNPDHMYLYRIKTSDFSVIDSITAITSISGIISHTDLAINASGTKVLTGGDYWNSRYCLFDFETYSYQYTTDYNLIGPNTIYTSYDKKFAISQVFLLARLIDLETGLIINRSPVGMPIGLAGDVSSIDDRIIFSDGSFYTLPEYPDEKFYMFDFSDHQNFHVDSVVYSGIEPEADMTNCAVISQDANKIIATNTLTNNISIIDIATGSLDTLIYMEGVSNAVPIPQSNFVIVSGTYASSIKILDLSTNEFIVDISGKNADQLFVDSDGVNAYAFEIISAEMGSLKKIDIDGASSQIVDELLIEYSNCLYGSVKTSTALSPDGNYMLFGGVDMAQGDAIHIVDTREMEVVDTIPVNNDCIYGYAFTDDSKRACALTSGSDIPIIYLDGPNSYIESEVFLDDISFSAEYNPVDNLFYVLEKSNRLCQVDPLSGDIIDEIPIACIDFTYQVGINQAGVPVVRSSNDIIYENQTYSMPGVSMDFSYDTDHDLFIIPIPGPDKVCVFDPLAVGITSFPKDIYRDNIKIYPNPACDLVSINSDNLIESVLIYNSQGKLMSSKDCNSKHISIAIDNLEAGVYIVVVKDTKKVSTQKLVITHS